MNNATRLTFVAVALLSGISVAAAADSAMSKSNRSTAQETMAKPSSAAQAKIKDRLSLTAKQRKDVWEDIRQQASKQTAPKGFTAKVGAVVPSALDTHPVPVSTANDVPALRPYNYALLDGNKLLIVNPNDKKVVEIITG
jgi:hypothetical protein